MNSFNVVLFSLATVAFGQPNLPTIQLALAPGANPSPKVSSVLSHLDARRVDVENAGLKELDAAYASALSAAKAEINSIVGGKSSFMQLQNPEVLVKVASPADVDPSSILRMEHVEQIRSGVESQRIAQAVSEFSAISTAVIGELRRALHSSFLSASDVNVKVKASSVPFPSTVDLLSATESGRDAGEDSFDSAVLSKQLSFVKALNAYIASALH